MTGKQLTPAEARARMAAKKAKKPNLRLSKAHAARTAKADRRARAFIERWLAGETHQQIADSEGVQSNTIFTVIEAYRRRHPDAGVPKRKSPTKRV